MEQHPWTTLGQWEGAEVVVVDHGELGVVGGRYARMVLDGKESSPWATGGDVGMSMGSRGGRGVAVRRRDGSGAGVTGVVVGVHVLGNLRLGERDTSSRGNPARADIVQWREERQGCTVVQPRAVARPFSSLAM